MPKKTVVKAKKGKLSPAERSQIAKDRWAKIKAAKAPAEPNMDYAPLNTPAPPVSEQDATETPSELEVSGLSIKVEADGGKTLAPAAPPVEVPAPQLAPVAPKKQKRYTGPKEFSVALKAAESRLAKAIVERAQAAGQLAALQAEIPSLLQIIAALKGQQNIPVVPLEHYRGGESFPNAQAFQAPMPQYPQPVDLGVIQAAMAQPPVSRAIGNAIQFSPADVGVLEGPDDDDEDRYLKGPMATGTWV